MIRGGDLFCPKATTFHPNRWQRYQSPPRRRPRPHPRLRLQDRNRKWGRELDDPHRQDALPRARPCHRGRPRPGSAPHQTLRRRRCHRRRRVFSDGHPLQWRRGGCGKNQVPASRFVMGSVMAVGKNRRGRSCHTACGSPPVSIGVEERHRTETADV